MLTLKTVSPSREFLTKLATRTIASWIPTGARWFSQDALKQTGELGKEVRALARLGGEFWSAVENQRFNIFLSTIAGDELAELGAALNLYRKAGESDNAYKQRIAAELIIERVTPVSVKALVPFLTKGAINSELYEPWRDVKFRSDASPRSGRGRRPGLTYYRGASFELQTDAYVEGLGDFVEKIKAAGTAYALSLQMEAQVDYNNDPLASVFSPTGEKMNFVTNSMDVIIEAKTDALPSDLQVIELPIHVDVLVNSSRLVTLASCFTWSNLSRNYSLATDMIASAAGGVPVYVTKDVPFRPDEPTDIQPAPYIVYETTLDNGALNDPGLVA